MYERLISSEQWWQAYTTDSHNYTWSELREIEGKKKEEEEEEEPSSSSCSFQSKHTAHLQPLDTWLLSDLGGHKDPEPANGRGSFHIRPGLENKCQLGNCRRTRAREGTCLCHASSKSHLLQSKQTRRLSQRGTCLQNQEKNETFKANKMTTSHFSQLCNSEIVSKFICAINNLGTFSPEIWKCQNSGGKKWKIALGYHQQRDMLKVLVPRRVSREVHCYPNP